MSINIVDLTEIEIALQRLEKSVEDFPYYNLAQKRQLKFGQYVTTIEVNRKTIIQNCAELREKVTKLLEVIDNAER